MDKTKATGNNNNHHRHHQTDSKMSIKQGASFKDSYLKLSSKHTVLILLWSMLIVFPQPAQCSVEKWTVGITGGFEEADRVASEHGCSNLGLVRGFNDVYLFEKQISDNLGSGEDDSRVHRTKRELEAHACVAWVDPQTPQTRVKRDFINKKQLLDAAKLVNLLRSHRGVSSARFMRSVADIFKTPKRIRSSSVYSAAPGASANSETNPFNDELWTHQWYLQDNSNVAQLQSDIELKVEDVWKMGYTGKGVVVTILDDGLEWNHTDILPNYDARASWDMNNNRSDPFPRYDSYDSNSHGTRCAGEVAMVANNRKCGVGVAPRAKIGGIKCLDGQVADHIESMSLLHNIDYIDIYSGSWGPSDDGQVVEGPKRLASHALERGIKYGRQGKGALYIWANGNGGAVGDNCNCDGYVNSIYTISIGGVTQQGTMPFYGERCASTLAVTCSSGAYTDRKIVTTDLHNKCTIDYTGTSAAAPLAAGIYALVLEANSNLTWRDAQHLTAWTSNPIPIRDNPGWKRNGAGLIFNSRFGFGLLNAKAMVDAALNWHNVPKKSICAVAPSTRLPMFIQSRNSVQAVFISDGCQREYENQQRLHQQQQQQPHHPLHIPVVGVPSALPPQQHGHLPAGAPVPPLASIRHPPSQPTPVIYLEHVQLIVDIEYTSRGSLDIFVISPSGTVSTMLSRRPLDTSRNGFDKWALMSVHFWGETSYGKWTVIVRDKDSQNNRGLLRNATLVLHGTTSRSAYMSKPRVYEEESQVQSFIDPVSELEEDDMYDLNTFPNEMSLVRDDSFQPTFIKSVVAMEQARDRHQ